MLFIGIVLCTKPWRALNLVSNFLTNTLFEVNSTFEPIIKIEGRPTKPDRPKHK